ncbi:MAG TPA: ABC transporter substrate-binding protein [Candidatus Dormibacteraeota bacterium]
MRFGNRTSIRRIAGVAAAAALVITALGSITTQAKSSGGGVVSFAELAGTPPTYISPLMSAEHESNANLYQFSNFMYLPLYWFGGDGQPKLNKTLSVANPPVFSDNNTVATVTLKHWVWSNGKPITARDVIFWMNLLSAVTSPNAPSVGSASNPGPGWFASVPGGFPENVVSYTQTGTYSLQFKMNASYNPTWFLFNELSQVYPLPQQEWDKVSASGPVGNYDTSAETRTTIAGTSPASYIPANAGTANSGALGVAVVLNNEASNVNTYASNPWWKTVDGPFKLAQFTSDGYAKFVPNKNYSGTPKPKLSAFVEEPFTTNLAEFNALRSGSITIGYLPSEDYGQKSSLEKNESYKLNPWYLFGFVYAGLNFTSPTVGPIFRQLYFRQALQSLINQKQWIKQFNDGQGTVNNGPVPTFPPNNADESPLEAHGQVYPYDPTKAVNLLRSHGWKVVPGGTTSCVKPGSGTGECGAGVKAGQQATFTMDLASGSQEATNEMDAYQSDLTSKAGIGLTIHQEPFATVIGTMDAGCTYSTPCSDWDMANWIGGWSYDPDFFPTGEEIFQTGAGSDVGDYSNPTNDANIIATNKASSSAAEHAALVKYQNFLAVNLPGLYLPNVPEQFTMYKSNLKGFLPQDVYDILYPQDYSIG